MPSMRLLRAVFALLLFVAVVLAGVFDASADAKTPEVSNAPKALLIAPDHAGARCSQAIGIDWDDVLARPGTLPTPSFAASVVATYDPPCLEGFIKRWLDPARAPPSPSS